MSADTDRNREEALRYVRRGLRLLPTAAASKAPNFSVLSAVYGSPEWGALAQRAASQPEVAAWFEHDADTGIGIITGNGLVVADFDRSPVGVRHPPTPTARTARGHHVYFAADRPVATARQPWGDLKGEGGYVVAPPSVHPDGHRYRWSIAPEDAPFAPLSSLHGLKPAVRAALQTSPPDRATGMAYEMPAALATSRGSGDELASVEAAVLAALPVLGISARLGSPFRCVLPGHADERPSASLFLDPRSGTWRYHDWHRASPSGREWWTLAEVRASQSAGREVVLAPPSASRWFRRLFFEAGVIEIRPPAVPSLPSSARSLVRRVAYGFALLLALRDVRDPGEPAPLLQRFRGGLVRRHAEAGAWSYRRTSQPRRVAHRRNSPRRRARHAALRDGPGADSSSSVGDLESRTCRSIDVTFGGPPSTRIAGPPQPGTAQPPVPPKLAQATERRCENCGGALGADRRPQTRHCKPACRAAASRKRATLREAEVQVARSVAELTRNRTVRPAWDQRGAFAALAIAVEARSRRDGIPPDASTIHEEALAALIKSRLDASDIARGELPDNQLSTEAVS